MRGLLIRFNIRGLGQTKWSVVAKPYVCVALLFHLIAPRCEATSVVGLWTPTKLVIGADSMQTSGEGFVAYACKISNRAKCVAASAGFSRDPVTHIDVARVRERALAARGT